MDAETVEGRKISADAKRGLMHQAMAIAAAQEAARSRGPSWAGSSAAGDDDGDGAVCLPPAGSSSSSWLSYCLESFGVFASPSEEPGALAPAKTPPVVAPLAEPMRPEEEKPPSPQKKKAAIFKIKHPAKVPGRPRRKR